MKEWGDISIEVYNCCFSTYDTSLKPKELIRMKKKKRNDFANTPKKKKFWYPGSLMQI